MIEQLPDKDVLQRYVLGELSPEEEQQVEEAYFREPAVARELCALRDELLDAWSQQQLPDHERDLLAQRLTELPALRERAAFALSLQQTLAAPLVPPPPAIPATPKFWEVLQLFFYDFKWVWLTATVVALAVLGWYASRSFRQPVQSAPEIVQTMPLPSASAGPTGTPKIAPPTVSSTPTITASHTPQPAAATVATFLLVAQATRSTDDAPALNIPATVKTVQLQLEVEPDWKGPFTARWKDADGELLWEKNGLTAQRVQTVRLVKLVLPAAKFTAATNVIQLQAADAPAQTLDYRFRVTR